MWLFLKVSWVGVQCVIVVFSDQTHLLFGVLYIKYQACKGKEFDGDEQEFPVIIFN